MTGSPVPNDFRRLTPHLLVSIEDDARSSFNLFLTKKDFGYDEKNIILGKSRYRSIDRLPAAEVRRLRRARSVRA